MQPINRAQPVLPVTAMKTYQILAPVETHWRQVPCTADNCPNHVHGWRSYVDESTELGRRQAHYVRTESGRECTGWRNEHGITEFTFPAGQQCFDVHRERVERPEHFLVRAGDHRSSLEILRRHASADDWVDDFANHQIEIAERVNRG
ncbi:MAG TPA: hypothetical protein VFB74_34105 [Kribbellaceae bacterium]|nr:hypothetical protein [Kribbellaceae bacterium]